MDLEDTTDVEFDVASEAVKDPADVIQRMKEFTYYLVENIEFNLDFCLKLLEGRSVPSKPNSLHVTALSLLCSAIPKIGGGLGGALKTGEVTLFRKIEKKNSKILADLVYYFSDNRYSLRKTIIESAAEVFACFENQFMQITCNGGSKRAMQKLAIDAADRIFNYFLITEQQKDITKNEIMKGVILGDSKRNRGGKKEGKTIIKVGTKKKVEDKNIKWKTCKLYSKVGIAIIEKNLFYKNDQTKPEKYGYRKIFSWEDTDDIMKSWTLDTHFEMTNYSLEITEDLLEAVGAYIMTKHPFEDSKLERQRYNEEAINDRKEKHEEALEILRGYFNKILVEMESLVLQITNISLENATLLKTVADNQEEEIKIQTEIISKLEVVHGNVVVTKEKQENLIETNKNIENQIVEIKNYQEEMAGAVVKQEDIEGIISSKVQESAKQEVKNFVHETLRNNDPGPRIKKEVERSMDKTRKELNRFENRVKKLFK